MRLKDVKGWAYSFNQFVFRLQKLKIEEPLLLLPKPYDALHKLLLIAKRCFIHYTAQKMKLSIKDFFSKCDQIRTKLLVTFSEEILNRKLHFWCSEPCSFLWISSHFLKKSIIEDLIFTRCYQKITKSYFILCDAYSR